MKLSAYIKHLQELESQGYGDLFVITASDDEGNSYHKCTYEPSVVEVEDLNEYYLGVIHPDDLEEYDETFKCILLN